MGEKSFGIDPSVLKTVAKEIHAVHRAGVETAIVIGGGNIFRGLNCSEYDMDRVQADHMGMLATVINALALGEALRRRSLDIRIMSAIEMDRITEPYIREKALTHLTKKRIVLLAAGTGSPYFSTDTAAALRAMELKAEVLLKATKVEGVYDSDPVENPSSKLFERLTYKEVIEKGLKVMDLTAVSLAMEQNLPIIVFNLRKKDNIKSVIFGQSIGTLITGENHERRNPI